MDGLMGYLCNDEPLRKKNPCQMFHLFPDMKDRNPRGQKHQQLSAELRNFNQTMPTLVVD